MSEYSKIARGSFTTASSPVAQVINLPFQPQRVEIECVTSFITPVQYATTSAFWDIGMGQGVAEQRYIAASAFPWTESVDYVATGGISTFAAGLSLQYGPKLQIVSITLATTNPLVTTAVPHGLSTGDVVVLQGLYQTATTGMPQIAGMPFNVFVASATTFNILWDNNQSNYTALSGSPVGSYVMKVLYPFLYFPGVSFIRGITFGTQTVVATTQPHNFVVGQEIAFRIPSAYATTQLNSLPNTQIPGSPIYGYVTAVGGANSFTCNINSSSFTTFNSNQPVSSVPGLQFPQVLAVGDVNTGGTPYSGGALYPSPVSGFGAATINGPAISGAFVNNTSQGFVIGLGVGAAAATNTVSAPLLVPSSLYIYTATLYDLSF